jgi:hypothetical protein
MTKSDLKMLFMVIERLRDNDMVPIYQPLREIGRSLPGGLEYVDSWIEPNFARCFQLMRCDDPRLFQEGFYNGVASVLRLKSSWSCLATREYCRGEGNLVAGDG